MRINKYTIYKSLILICFCAIANCFCANTLYSDSAFKNIITVETDFIRIKPYSYYFYNIKPNQITKSSFYNIGVSYNRFIKNNLFIGIKATYLNLEFNGDYFLGNITDSQYIKINAPENRSINLKANYFGIQLQLKKDFQVFKSLYASSSFQAGIAIPYTFSIYETLSNSHGYNSDYFFKYNYKDFYDNDRNRSFLNYLNTSVHLGLKYVLLKRGFIEFGVGYNYTNITLFKYWSHDYYNKNLNILYTIKYGYKI
jgi:hypothetical protein